MRSVGGLAQHGTARQMGGNLSFEHRTPSAEVGKPGPATAQRPPRQHAGRASNRKTRVRGAIIKLPRPPLTPGLRPSTVAHWCQHDAARSPGMACTLRNGTTRGGPRPRWLQPAAMRTPATPICHWDQDGQAGSSLPPARSLSHCADCSWAPWPPRHASNASSTSSIGGAAAGPMTMAARQPCLVGPFGGRASQQQGARRQRAGRMASQQRRPRRQRRGCCQQPGPLHHGFIVPVEPWKQRELGCHRL